FRVDDQLNRHDLTGEVLFRARAGCPWRDLPRAVREQEHRLRPASPLVAGRTWGQVLDVLRAGCDEVGSKDWTVSADSPVGRAHRHAAGARRALPADLARGQGRMTTIRQAAGRAGRPWAARAAG